MQGRQADARGQAPVAGRRWAAALAATFLALASGLAGDLPRGGAATTQQPVHDAHVAAKSPDRNYGTASALESDRSPVLVTYLISDLRALTQPVPRATLRMYRRAVREGSRRSGTSRTTAGRKPR